MKRIGMVLRALAMMTIDWEYCLPFATLLFPAADRVIRIYRSLKLSQTTVGLGTRDREEQKDKDLRPKLEFLLPSLHDALVDAWNGCPVAMGHSPDHLIETIHLDIEDLSL